MATPNKLNSDSMFGFMLDEQGNLPDGFKEFVESFNELNDEMVKLFTDNPIFPKWQMGTLKGKIKIPDNFDTAFSNEIADMFEGKWFLDFKNGIYFLVNKT